MTLLDIDWEYIEAAIMFASVCGTIVAGYVAMRKDKRGDESIWLEIVHIKAAIERKADLEHLFALQLKILQLRHDMELDAAEADAEKEEESPDE